MNFINFLIALKNGRFLYLFVNISIYSRGKKLIIYIFIYITYFSIPKEIMNKIILLLVNHQITCFLLFTDDFTMKN